MCSCRNEKLALGGERAAISSSVVDLTFAKGTACCKQYAAWGVRRCDDVGATIRAWPVSTKQWLRECSFRIRYESLLSDVCLFRTSKGVKLQEETRELDLMIMVEMRYH